MSMDDTDSSGYVEAPYTETEDYPGGDGDGFAGDSDSGMGAGEPSGPDSMPTEMMDPISAINNDLGDPIGGAENLGSDVNAVLNDPVGSYESGMGSVEAGMSGALDYAEGVGSTMVNEPGLVLNNWAEYNSPIVTGYKMAEGIDGSMSNAQFQEQQQQQQDVAAAVSGLPSEANAMLDSGVQMANQVAEMGANELSELGQSALGGQPDPWNTPAEPVSPAQQFDVQQAGQVASGVAHQAGPIPGQLADAAGAGVGALADTARELEELF
jgi:hypothetical protein